MVRTHPHSHNLRVLSALLCFALLALLLAAASVAIRPCSAFADYSMPKVSITAQAETDGSLHVIEQRVFRFDGDCSSVQWDFPSLSPTSEVHVNSVRMVSLGDDGTTSGYPQILESVPFVLEWRDSGGPGIDAYSFDQARNAVHVFFDASGGQRLIELDYTVENGVNAYSDVGEVYWQFIGTQWDVASENVEMTLMLPMPADATVVPGDNVRAWGHGPQGGQVKVNEDGSIVYTVGRVEAGEYAEARVLFPSEWLTNLPAGTEEQPRRTEAHLSSALSEEQAWADQGSRSRAIALAVVMGSALVCLIVLALGLRVYFRYGREYEPDFKDDYWRQVPDPDVHPALIGRLWRWNRRSFDDFCATLMHLVALGKLRLEGSDAEAQGSLLVRVPGKGPSDPLDDRALDIVFDAAGVDRVSLGQLREYAALRPQAFRDAVDGWQALLSERSAEHAFFEEPGKKWQIRLVVVAGVLAAVLLGASLATGTVLPFVFAVVSSSCLVLLGNYCERRSRAGNELCAKCKALRNWLRDLGARDVREAPDAPWGELAAYSFLFGVSEHAEQVLSEALPEQREALAGEHAVAQAAMLAAQAAGLADSPRTAGRDRV